MNDLFPHLIAAPLALTDKQVRQTLALLDDGATIPFISRYRKEATGGLDEVQIESICDRYEKLKETERRKETILTTIEAQGKLTDALKQRIADTWDNTELEDLYLPYRPKRKTRAEAARQKGLEPLATLLLLQKDPAPDRQAKSYVKGDVKSVEEALKGACDIIAEQVSEDERSRQTVRTTFDRRAVITARVVKGKEAEAANYRDYFDVSDPLKRCSSHRLLAMRRAEAEGVLKVSIAPDEDDTCLERLERRYVRGNNACSRYVADAVQDAYKRLLKPSIETEFAASSKERADDEAIRVFAANLRQLLLASPLGQKRVMGIDPGFRTGCKVVCLDAQGNLLHNENIYPHPPVSKPKEAAQKIQKMVEAYRIEAMAIGNGTASRETEDFLKHLRFDRDMQIFVVSEQGASIYSASKLAREEFPDYDVAGEDRPEVHRRGPVPARRGPDETEEIARPDGGKLCESRRSQPEHSQQPPADLHIGARTSVGTKHRQLPCRTRPFRLAPRPAEGSSHGRQGFRTMRWIPTHPQCQEPAGQHSRPSRELRHRRTNGQGPGLHRQ